jgi:hypothetical protein
MEAPVTKHKTSATTQTVTSSRELLKALTSADLTHEEELVLRMRFGIPESGSTELQFRGVENPEVAARLAFIESNAVRHAGLQSVDETGAEGEELKSSIIEDLRGI